MISPADILSASILIVDDQAANVALLEQTLRGAGYTAVTSTRNPLEVCELYRKHRYLLILLDLQMPGLDGFQVMDGLKAIDTDGYLSVLVVTAQPDHKMRAFRAGAKDFVSKPFDLAEVLMRVHNLLEVRLFHLAAEKRKNRAEGKLIEAQKMDVIGQLAAGVAHDFNNILAVIMGYSDLMMAKLGPDPTLKNNLEMIRRAAERAAGLTRQLLIFSRKQTVQLLVLDLNDVVNDLEQMLRRLIDESIDLTIVAGEQAGRVRADSGYVGQILMNLVVNARDAMPRGGKLSIATNNVTLDETYARKHTGVIPGEYVMLSVSDTGTGMTDEVKEHLFEALFTTKPFGEGTGLGLTTCQTIVQQSGGHIGVYSELGKGTTFKVYFPRVDLPLGAVAGRVPSGPLPRGKETLMVVEDDSALRHLAIRMLEAQGYQVLAASNGRDALLVATEHQGSPISLVVTDVIMPVMGGQMMADWLKTTFPDLKILFTSGYTDDALSQHGALRPDMAFIPKPYTSATLVRKVRAMLDNETDTAMLRREQAALNQTFPIGWIEPVTKETVSGIEPPGVT